jgi:aminomethyltransferase
MVPFGGWEMPIRFDGILAEAKAVRSHAGLFDVSHMGRLQISGEEAASFLHRLVTADVLSMPVGRVRYTLLCNEGGGIIDDAILYRLGEERFLLVPNAANENTVARWLQRWAAEWHKDVAIRWLTLETSMIALQGPLAEELLQPVCSLPLSLLGPFRCVEGQVSGVPVIVSRTGYTGEDGFEVILPAEHGPSLWLNMVERGAAPCGLGARDVLRLEAGLLLHGSDMDATVTPLEAGLERFLIWDKGEFVGLQALREIKGRGLSRSLVGFRMVDRGVPRAGYHILDGERTIGEVSSGTHSPTLDTGIGLGYVFSEFVTPGATLVVDLRGRQGKAEVTALPFYSRKRKHVSH